MCDANRLKMKEENIFSSCLPSPLLSCSMTSQLVGILVLKLQIWGSFIILVISRWLLMPNLIFSISRSPKFLLELRWNDLLCIKSAARKVLTNQQVHEGLQGKTPCDMPPVEHATSALSKSLTVGLSFLFEEDPTSSSAIVEVDLGCRWRSCCGLTCRKMGL